MQHIDIALLRALDALVRARSVTAAGRELGLTQSATSHALARLRATFGDDLFVRTASGMVPTALAEELAGRARAILADVERLAADRARFDPATARRTFAIAMSDGGQLLVLPALLEDLAAAAPGVTVTVRAPSPHDGRLLATGELALALGAPRAGDGLYRQALLEDRLVWVIRRTPRGPARLSLADYAARGRVRIEGRGPNQALERALAEAALGPVSTVTVHSLLAAVLIVLRSDRVLAASYETATALAHAMPLRVVEPPLAFGGIPIVQQWHARLHSDRAHAWLRQRIKRLVDRRAWARR